MAIRTHLLDASVLVKLIIPEHKSDVVQEYFDNNSYFGQRQFASLRLSAF
jgi:hypothetical protein